MHLTIDERSVQVPAGYTLLQSARENGVAIPTLCYHESLLPYGACRLCLVELASARGSRLVAACTYPCEEGQVVQTHNERVLDARRAVAELLLATSGHLPAVRAIAAQLGVGAPYVALEENDCILCGLCVRACREIVGVSAIGLNERGIAKRVGTPFQSSSGDCIECGTCALVCPTGAIRIQDVSRPARTSHTWESAYARRACRLCESDPPGAAFPADYGELLGTAGDRESVTGDR